MNWMRWNEQWMLRARDFASRVLPTPGTSSMRTWPSESSEVTTRSTTSRFPWITRSMFSAIASKWAPNQFNSAGATGCSGNWSPS